MVLSTEGATCSGDGCAVELTAGDDGAVELTAGDEGAVELTAGDEGAVELTAGDDGAVSWSLVSWLRCFSWDMPSAWNMSMFLCFTKSQLSSECGVSGHHADTGLDS